MEARAADLVLVDERDLESELGGPERRRVAAGARAEHDEIEVVGRADSHGSGCLGAPRGRAQASAGQVGHRGRWYARCRESRNRGGRRRAVHRRTGKPQNDRGAARRREAVSFAAHRCRRAGVTPRCVQEEGGAVDPPAASDSRGVVPAPFGRSMAQSRHLLRRERCLFDQPVDRMLRAASAAARPARRYRTDRRRRGPDRLQGHRPDARRGRITGFKSASADLAEVRPRRCWPGPTRSGSTS